MLGCLLLQRSGIHASAGGSGARFLLLHPVALANAQTSHVAVHMYAAPALSGPTASLHSYAMRESIYSSCSALSSLQICRKGGRMTHAVKASCTRINSLSLTALKRYLHAALQARHIRQCRRGVPELHCRYLVHKLLSTLYMLTCHHARYTKEIFGDFIHASAGYTVICSWLPEYFLSCLVRLRPATMPQRATSGAMPRCATSQRTAARPSLRQSARMLLAISPLLCMLPLAT